MLRPKCLSWGGVESQTVDSTHSLGERISVAIGKSVVEEMSVHVSSRLLADWRSVCIP